MEVLLFGGTTEGRRLAEWLDARNTCSVVACTATEYGASLITEGANITRMVGPLSHDDKRVLMEQHDFVCIVDTTHPYAEHISASIDELARSYAKDVVRLTREVGPTGSWTSVANAREAARMVAAKEGVVLLTTGTNDLRTFVDAMVDYTERLYVRILPTPESLARTLELGIPASHVIAMQGPFSAQLNRALLEELQAKVLVTKRSGAAGGFEQKVQAARECGVELVVVERPHKEKGLSLGEAQALLEERYGL